MMKISAVVALIGAVQAWNYGGYGGNDYYGGHGGYGGYGGYGSRPRSYGGYDRGYNRGYVRGYGDYNSGGFNDHHNSGPYGSDIHDAYGRPKTKKAYDAVEYFGDNGMDYGFGEKKAKVTVDPNSNSYEKSFSKSFSSSTFGGSANNADFDFDANRDAIKSITNVMADTNNFMESFTKNFGALSGMDGFGLGDLGGFGDLLKMSGDSLFDNDW